MEIASHSMLLRGQRIGNRAAKDCMQLNIKKIESRISFLFLFILIFQQLAGISLNSEKKIWTSGCGKTITKAVLKICLVYFVSE